MIDTRLTRAFGLTHPIIGAPMAGAAGGRLAAAVSAAGGLGLIGGGYCDADWIAREFEQAGNQAVGCGFITWRLAQAPGLLRQVIARGPRAIFLSFGDPAPHLPPIQSADIPWIAQVQTLEHARHAAGLGATAIVAQGGEAGGHGATRGTMALVPEVADMLARDHPNTLPLAAGGIADGRGLAAALMLGADGIVLGSRLWASDEASVHPGLLDAAMTATGDDTIRTRVIDIARGFDWPAPYTCRVLKNAFSDRWHNDLTGLIAAAADEAPRWMAAQAAGDPTLANPIVGEAAGIIDAVRPAGQIIETIVDEAASLLAGGWKREGQG